MFLLSDESINYKIKVVGCISISSKEFSELENDITQLRVFRNFFEEIKWNTFSKESIPFYIDLVALFFKYKSARFHSNSYLNGQQQYKVSYKLIESISWKLKDVSINERFYIYFDHTDKGTDEVATTLKYLNKSNRCYHIIQQCEDVDSKTFELIGLADLFTGCLAYSLNLSEDLKCVKHPGKSKFIEQLILLDENLPLQFPAEHIFNRWGYFDRKFQHYNLHIRKHL